MGKFLDPVGVISVFVLLEHYFVMSSERTKHKSHKLGLKVFPFCLIPNLSFDRLLLKGIRLLKGFSQTSSFIQTTLSKIKSLKGNVANKTIDSLFALDIFVLDCFDFNLSLQLRSLLDYSGSKQSPTTLGQIAVM